MVPLIKPININNKKYLITAYRTHIIILLYYRNVSQFDNFGHPKEVLRSYVYDYVLIFYPSATTTHLLPFCTAILNDGFSSMVS